MKIAIASLGNPRSVSTWSGIPAHIVSALEKRGHRVQGISLRRPVEPWYYDWFRRFYFRVQNKFFLASVEMEWLKSISRQLDDEVNMIRPDVVLVIHGDWLAYATFQYPACIIHDTTFSTIVNYYPTFKNLSARSLKMGNQMYQRALDKSVVAIFSAGWASRSAGSHYHIPASKIFTVPFGANIDEAPSQEEVLQWIEFRAESESCNFLFIGTQWFRKGGPDCLRFVAALNRSGIKSTLTVVGCTPEIPKDMQGVVDCVGYLKKEYADDLKKFNHLLQKANALIVLSEAECFGCVYCEANAFGLPALGRDTGGVPEIIREGINGLLLKSHESPEKFAERWAEIWKDRNVYRSMARNCYSEFVLRLNYDAFVRKLEEILSGVIENKTRI